MKKLLIALVACAYAVPAAIILAARIFMANETPWIFILPAVLVLPVCGMVAANIAGAALAMAKRKCLPFKTVLVFKISLVPFYIANFFVKSLSMLLGPWGIGFMLLAMVIATYNWWIMLGASAHNVAKLILLRGAKRITTKQLVIHGLLQLMFLPGVADSIYLAKKLDLNPTDMINYTVSM